MFLEAQDHAVTTASIWCAARLDLVGAAPGGSPDAFPSLFATIVDDWSREHRALSLTWRECYLLSARDARYEPAINAWRILWAGFWEELCARCGLTGFGESSSYVFDGESLLHLMHWRQPVDRACLDEFARGWGNWLCGRLAVEGPWRRFAREEALRTRPDVPVQEGAAARIAAAAADVVEASGIAGLTHRAVAERAGVTLGTVSYNFKTVSDLIRATFETLYSRVVPPSYQGVPVVKPVTSSDRIAGLRTLSPVLLAMEELTVSVARDPAYAAFAPQLRYLRGRTSGPILRAMLGTDHTPSPLDAALYSSFLGGQGRALFGLSEDVMRGAMERTSERLLARLGGGKSLEADAVSSDMER